MDRKKSILLILVFSLVMAIISPVSAQGITASVGETWIKWQWGANETPVDVYIDGMLRVAWSNISYYYLTGVEPLERHNIQTYNSSNTSELWRDSTVTTLYPKWVIYFLTGFEIILTLALLLSQDNVKILLIGAVTIALALFTSAIARGYEGLYLLPIIVAIAAGAYIAYALWIGVRGNVAWY